MQTDTLHDDGCLTTSDFPMCGRSLARMPHCAPPEKDGPVARGKNVCRSSPRSGNGLSGHRRVSRQTDTHCVPDTKKQSAHTHSRHSCASMRTNPSPARQRSSPTLLEHSSFAALPLYVRLGHWFSVFFVFFPAIHATFEMDPLLFVDWVNDSFTCASSEMVAQLCANTPLIF